GFKSGDRAPHTPATATARAFARTTWPTARRAACCPRPVRMMSAVGTARFTAARSTDKGVRTRRRGASTASRWELMTASPPVPVHEPPQCLHREDQPVEVVIDVDVAREPGAGEARLDPGSVRPL